jgi:hypothetical protein
VNWSSEIVFCIRHLRHIKNVTLKFSGLFSAHHGGLVLQFLWYNSMLESFRLDFSEFEEESRKRMIGEMQHLNNLGRHVFLRHLSLDSVDFKTLKHLMQLLHLLSFLKELKLVNVTVRGGDKPTQKMREGRLEKVNNMRKLEGIVFHRLGCDRRRVPGSG